MGVRDFAESLPIAFRDQKYDDKIAMLVVVTLSEIEVRGKAEIIQFAEQSGAQNV